MNKLAFRRPTPLVVVCGLFLISLSNAAAGENPRRTPQAREAFRTVVPPQAASCRICDVAQEKCLASCFADAEKGEMETCLTACNKAVADCTCDGTVNLRSEDLVQWGVVSMNKSGCHTNVRCPSNYQSCTNWSDESICEDLYCAMADSCTFHCEQGFCWPIGDGPAYYSPRERYRICFDEYANPCTEWSSYSIVTCAECEPW